MSVRSFQQIVNDHDARKVRMFHKPAHKDLVNPPGQIIGPEIGFRTLAEYISMVEKDIASEGGVDIHLPLEPFQPTAVDFPPDSLQAERARWAAVLAPLAKK